MAYDEYLSERVANILKSKTSEIEEKKMFGGICFMVNKKMCLGVVKNELMARVDPEDYEKLLLKNGTRKMDFTKKPMKGFLFIDPIAFDSDSDLEFWIDTCLRYNPEAKSSRKK